MRARTAPIFLAGLLLAPILLAALGTPASAAIPLKEPLEVSYSAHVTVNPATPERVDVEVTLSPASRAFSRIVFFAPATTGGSPALLSLDGPHGMQTEGGRWTIPAGTVPDTLRIRYSFNPTVTRSDGGADFIVTPDFALLKAETLLPRFSLVEYNNSGGLKESGGLVAIHSRVSFTHPTTWSVAGPYSAPGGSAFDIPVPRQGLPDITGYVVLGPLAASTFTSHGIPIHMVTVAGGKRWDGFQAFLDAAIPYYRAVYGDTVGAQVVATAVPAPPMRRGGAALGASTFWATDGSPQTWAHEFAHLWQDWITDATVGTSDVWLKEGGAEYHSAMALRYAGVWSEADLDRFLSDKHAALRRSSENQRPLTVATYGTDEEDAAYLKGLFTVADIDDSLHRGGNPRGLMDLYRLLDRDVDEEGGVHAVLWRFLGANGWPNGLRDRLSLALNTTNTPAMPSLREGARLVLADPLPTPREPTPGAAFTLTTALVNLGTEAGAAEGVLRWSGGNESVPVSANVPRGGHRNLTLAIPGATAGNHHVAFAGQTATFRVPPPTVATVANVTLSEPFTEGEPFTITVTVENRGDGKAAFAFDLAYNGRVLLTQPWSLDGGENHTFTYPVGKYERGTHTITVGDHAPVTFTVIAPADIVVASIRSPSVVTTGTPFDVLVTVENRGTEPGERPISIRVDGMDTDPITVRLDGGEKQEITFPVTVDAEGTARIEVEGVRPLDVSARAPGPLGLPNGVPGPEAWLALAAAGLAALAAGRRLRRPQR